MPSFCSSWGIGSFQLILSSANTVWVFGPMEAVSPVVSQDASVPPEEASAMPWHPLYSTACWLNRKTPFMLGGPLPFSPSLPVPCFVSLPQSERIARVRTTAPSCLMRLARSDCNIVGSFHDRPVILQQRPRLRRATKLGKVERPSHVGAAYPGISGPRSRLFRLQLAIRVQALEKLDQRAMPYRVGLGQ